MIFWIVIGRIIEICFLFSGLFVVYLILGSAVVDAKHKWNDIKVMREAERIRRDFK